MKLSLHERIMSKRLLWAWLVVLMLLGVWRVAIDVIVFNFRDLSYIVLVTVREQVLTITFTTIFVFYGRHFLMKFRDQYLQPNDGTQRDPDLN